MSIWHKLALSLTLFCVFPTQRHKYTQRPPHVVYDMSGEHKNINTLTTTQIQPLLLDCHPEHDDDDGHGNEDSDEGNDDNNAGGGDDD